MQKSFQLIEAPLPPPPAPACSDGQDNDRDGQVDYPSDPGCSSASDGDEANVVDPPPPSGACGLTATPSSFASQVTAAIAGQTICLASGNYGTWSGTNKAITVRKADGAIPTMRFSFGSGDANFIVDGVSGAGGSLGGGVSNVTVKNSAFNTCMNFDGSNSSIVFDNNTHLSIDATCGNARLHMAGSGITIRNSLMQGGDSDGVFIASDGVTIDNNRIVGLCEGPTGNHTDGIQYEDPNGVDTPDTSNTSGHNAIVRRNYISFVGCGGYGQALASYDSGTENALIEDNVVDTTRPGGIELYSDDGSIVRHNTVRFYAEGPCAFTGQTCGKIELTRKLHDAVGVGTQVYDNVGEVDFGNGSTAARNDHNTDPSTVSYVGPLTSRSWIRTGIGFAGQQRCVGWPRHGHPGALNVSRYTKTPLVRGFAPGHGSPLNYYVPGLRVSAWAA